MLAPNRQNIIAKGIKEVKIKKPIPLKDKPKNPIIRESLRPYRSAINPDGISNATEEKNKND